MPRPRRLAEPFPTVSPNLIQPYQADLATCSLSSSDFAHALFIPEHYEPGYAYPLIVWLHGHGTDQRQLPRIMPLVSMRNYVAVAPCGFLGESRDHALAGPATPGDAAHERYQWLQTDDHIQQAAARVFECIDLAGGRYHINRQRIFLAGFDDGGTMALRLALSHPDRFAGVISLCGALPTGRALFGNLVAARRLGIFLATGRGSRQYAADRVSDDLRLLHTAGLSLELRQYPCGHELPPQMLSDVDRWIIAQITAASAAVPAESDPEWSREAE